MSTDIEAVIFDIGNVLIEWQPERYYDAPSARTAAAPCSPRSTCTA
jgi:FMN phosphatase YigB (HAD superfamily)